MADDTLAGRERTASTSVRDAQASTANLSTERGEGERLIRAREAWIAARRPFKWTARRVRAGKMDGRLRSIVIALEDATRPLSLVLADRDEATAAIIMRATPGLFASDAIAAALLDAIRAGRRG